MICPMPWLLGQKMNRADRMNKSRDLFHLNVRRRGLCAAVIGFVMGCATLGCDQGFNNEDLITRVQLDEGTTYVYAWSLSFEDSTGAVISVLTDTFSVRVVSIDDSLADTPDLTRVEVTSSGTDVTGTVWYQHTSAALEEVAVQSINVLPPIAPKRAPQTQTRSLNLFRGATTSGSIGADSVMIHAARRSVYRYPMGQGRRWVVASIPFVESREVVRLENLTVAGGTFETVVLRTEIPNLDAEAFDFVAREGLILRTFEVHEENATIGGTIRPIAVTREHLELISLSP